MAITTLHSVSTKGWLMAALLVFFGTSGQALGNEHSTGAPLSLDRWKDWVLYEQPELECPVMFNSDNRVCQWLGQLELNAGNAGQSVETFAETRF